MTQIPGYRHSHLLYGGRVTGNNRIRSALEIYFRNVLRSLRREIRNEENAVFYRATHAGVNRIRRDPRDPQKKKRYTHDALFVYAFFFFFFVKCCGYKFPRQWANSNKLPILYRLDSMAIFSISNSFET